MSKPVVAIDLDGVVYDWGGTVRYLMRQHHGIDLPVSSSWDYVEHNVPPEAWSWLWREGIELGLFKYGHHLKGSVDGLRELAEIASLRVVTMRPRSALMDTLRFVEGLPDVFDGVHFLTDGEPKSSVACDIYLDDAPHVVNEVVAAGRRVVLFDQAWNQPDGPDELPFGVVRAFGWHDVPFAVELVQELEEGLWL